MDFEDVLAIIVVSFFIGAPILGGVIAGIGELLAPKKKYENLTKELNDKYEKECADLEKKYVDKKFKLENVYSGKEAKLKDKEAKLENEYDRKYMIMEQTIAETSQSQPWISKFIADANYEYDLSCAKILETKQRPAFKAAEEVKRIGQEKRELQVLYRTTKYQLDYYEQLFPWLEEFREVDINEAYQIAHETNDSQNEYDTLKNWLSPEEYQKLPNAEKYQLALDRYKNKKNKSKWQIGIEYERYIGYLYEQKGYKVQYFGALEGLNDLGRDLIAENGKKLLIIQCKYWSDTKTIHEKHIFQLFGTVTEYRIKYKETLKRKSDVLHSIDNNCTYEQMNMLDSQISNHEKAPNKNKHHNPKSSFNPIGVFVTSTCLSDTALLVAKELGIEVVQNKSFDRNYPCIKCNINPTTKEKIYHLPFDQQYDKIVISPKSGECYASSVQEAEELGFRRAHRWKGNLVNNQ